VQNTFSCSAPLWRETFKRCEDTVNAGIDAARVNVAPTNRFFGIDHKRRTLANAVVRP
jgi:hypothetical protein